MVNNFLAIIAGAIVFPVTKATSKGAVRMSEGCSMKVSSIWISGHLAAKSRNIFLSNPSYMSRNMQIRISPDGFCMFRTTEA